MKNSIFMRAMHNLMCEGKRYKICLVKAGNVVNSGAMDKFSNEKQTNFRLFNLCKRFCIALFIFTISLMMIACIAPKHSSISNVSITEQLRIDFENENISKDSYYSYLAYCVFAQDLLPKKYNGKLAPHDASPIIRQIQRAYPTLSRQTQEYLKQWIKPLPPKPMKPDRNP